VRTGIPDAVGYAVLRRFHAAAAMTMVATNSLRQELSQRGFRKLGFWTRGVDTNLFRPDAPAALDLPRPIFMTVGRVAVEKNLEAFLVLDLPGSKVVIGNGPQKAELERRFPQAKFLGEKTGNDLTSHMAAADVFVFPSLTDTFGVVQLEALACGTPVAAFPVTGPLDVIADHPIGAIDKDLRRACMRALEMSRETCRSFALERSWDNSARQFIGNLAALQPSRSLRSTPVLAGSRPVRG
jgi:glycosyltransferase involved in cell wall biosynthesis